MAYPSFRLLGSKPIEHLNITVNEYEHIKTKAKHYHIAADREENVFLVALRTVPSDSTGVAHILEHTVLCGSEKFPVRDPFFMMLRRSLNTFMNAFTSSDWTAYPFATQNKKDYFNLLSVYLDAVFFSRLDPLDFAQEGHRLEFEAWDDPSSALTFKGVVYNEMKGAMSSPNSMLYDLLGRYLFPHNTYHYNSGGDPRHIPDLSYAQLLAFYKKHYHPSNAAFFTFGDIPADQLQEQFDKAVLHKFSAQSESITVPLEKRYFAPVQVEEFYGVETKESCEKKTYMLMAWLLGSCANTMDRLEAYLLSQALLDNSASPLRKALETFPYASAPSSLCGLEDSQREMSFICGVDGSDPEHVQAFETLVLDVLKQVAEEGIPLEQLESVCHQIELSQREIGGDGYPYGLQLILAALPGAIHNSDPIELLDIDPFLNQLRTNIQSPDYIKNLTRKLLLENPHRVRLMVKPDPQLNQRAQQAEKDQLALIRANLNDSKIQEIIEQAKTLNERQSKKNDDSILPKVTLEDVPAEIKIVSAKDRVKEDKLPEVTYFNEGTNGISYLQYMVSLADLQEVGEDLPLFCTCLPEVGLGGLDYLQVQAWQSRICGGISAFANLRSNVDQADQNQGYFVVSAKALNRNVEKTIELLHQTFSNPRFDEAERIKELISQNRIQKEKSVTGQGHNLAMTAASSCLNALNHYQHQVSGLAGIQQIKALDQRLKGEQQNAAQNALRERFQAIQARLLNLPLSVLLVSDEDPDRVIQALKNLDLPAISEQGAPQTLLTEVNSHIQQGWLTNTQVNFCAQAFKTVPATHQDSAALTVLGGFLRNGYLHTAIREKGGAYGGGAGHVSSNGLFRFYSYRDPRIEGTLEDFQKSIEWLLGQAHSDESLEQAILGVISDLDKPGSPAGEAIQAHYDRLYGRTPAFRKEYRERVMRVTVKDLQNVAQTYLTATPCTAIVTNQAAWQTFSKRSAFETFEL